ARSERLTGWPARSLCQMAAVSARMRCRTRTITPSAVWPPCCSRSSWPLKVSLTGSMIWRSGLKNRGPARSGSPLRAGRRSVIPAPALVASKVAPSGRHGPTCGDAFSISSVLTYSAVARVSRSASTRASGFDVGLATPILDTFSARHDATRRVRPLGIGHLAGTAAVLAAGARWARRGRRGRPSRAGAVDGFGAVRRPRPQHEELGVVGGRRAAEQDQPATDPDEDQIEEAKGHGRSSWPNEDPAASLQFTGQADLWHPTGEPPTCGNCMTGSG